MTTNFNEMNILVSEKHVVEEVMSFSNFSETFEVFLIAQPRFCFQKLALKMLSFQKILLLKEPMVANLSETCVLTSSKNVAEEGMNIQNLPEI